MQMHRGSKTISEQQPENHEPLNQGPVDSRASRRAFLFVVEPWELSRKKNNMPMSIVVDAERSHPPSHLLTSSGDQEKS